MAEIQKNQTKTVSHKKVENGYVVTLSTTTEKKEKFEHESKQYVTKTAMETNELIAKLIK